MMGHILILLHPNSSTSALFFKGISRDNLDEKSSCIPHEELPWDRTAALGTAGKEMLNNVSSGA